MGSKTIMLVGINSWLTAESNVALCLGFIIGSHSQTYTESSQIRNSVYLRATDTCFNELSQINNELACVLTEYQQKIAQKKACP